MGTHWIPEDDMAPGQDLGCEMSLGQGANGTLINSVDFRVHAGRGLGLFAGHACFETTEHVFLRSLSI
jgi:hypothetical protein